MGPALAVVLGMLEGEYGSEIVVVTDGESTTGIGSGYRANEDFKEVSNNFIAIMTHIIVVRLEHMPEKLELRSVSLELKEPSAEFNLWDMLLKRVAVWSMS